MKREKLNYPHSWEERRPAVSHRVLFIPDYYFEHDAFEMPPFSSADLFGNENPVYIEYCSGNGEWIIEKAASNPMINWVAVEMKFKRVRKIFSKMQQRGLSNLIIVCGDANEFIRYYLKEASIDAIFINFPDPWPKEKHAKHRLIQREFVSQMKRTLKPNRDVTIVTDHPEYSLQVIGEMRGDFESQYPHPYYTEKDPEYGSSYFNRLWEGMGCFIRFMKFKKIIG
ncbi:MAG: tRNA (guanine(46)-N(7))-methyltransferase TrmB [Simkaniaceae bacterium]|nr:tRNA (guanine(46)-N(7))-methyltransferase TrmB [Simkaniaceae bacterium]MCF7852896.1 tRNA (guanine(46)-N(7))-methyltransferase TrmB [Simkaniaceae bacterium]